MGNIRRLVLVGVVLSFVLTSGVSAAAVKFKTEQESVETTTTATIPSPIIPSVETQVSAASGEKNNSFRWNVFQVGAGAIFDSEGGNSGALSLTYNPTYSLVPSLSLKAYLGGILSNVLAGSVFLIGDLGLTLKYNFSSSLSIEGGWGIQYWSGSRLRNTHSQLKAAVGFDSFQITYASVFDPLFTAHQILGAISFEI